MTDVYEHNPQDHDDPVAGPTWLIGFLGTILLVAIMLGTTALYYNVKAGKVDEQVVRPERAEVAKLHRAQEAMLTGPPRWVQREDQGEMVTALVIPIEDAMDLVVAEANAGGDR